MISEVHNYVCNWVAFIYLPVKKSSFTHFPDSRTVESYYEKSIFFFNAFINALILQPWSKLVVIVVDYHYNYTYMT